MIKIWQVTGKVEYGWCLVIVSADTAKQAIKVAKGAKYAGYVCTGTWYAKHIQGITDLIGIPRILAQEIGQE